MTADMSGKSSQRDVEEDLVQSLIQLVPVAVPSQSSDTLQEDTCIYVITDFAQV